MTGREQDQESGFVAGLVSHVVDGGLHLVTASPESVLKTYQDMGRKVERLDDVFQLPIPPNELAADSFIQWAKVQASALGAAMGTGGPLLLIPEFGSLMVLSVRTVLNVGQCYGFPVSSESALREAWLVLGASMGWEGAGQTLAEQFLRTAPKAIMRNPYAKMPLISLVREILKRCGIRLYKRHFAKLIPFLGGIFGAGANWFFLSGVGTYSKSHFEAKKKSWQEAGCSPQYE